jgi:hypothetical protein
MSGAQANKDARDCSPPYSTSRSTWTDDRQGARAAGHLRLGVPASKRVRGLSASRRVSPGRAAGLDALEDFFAMDLNIFRCIDTDLTCIPLTPRMVTLMSSLMTMLSPTLRVSISM